MKKLFYILAFMAFSATVPANADATKAETSATPSFQAVTSDGVAIENHGCAVRLIATLRPGETPAAATHRLVRALGFIARANPTGAVEFLRARPIAVYGAASSSVAQIIAEAPVDLDRQPIKLAAR